MQVETFSSPTIKKTAHRFNLKALDMGEAIGKLKRDSKKIQSIYNL
jgi:hypothetical protein